MAVVVKYVVERNGVERMTFTTKKEADAYDKMLDIAESLELMLEKVDVPLSEQQIESLALEIAKSKEDFMTILKGGKDPVVTKVPTKTKKSDNVASTEDNNDKKAS
ncbi:MULTISPECIES: YebG family protein [Pseudoalteromonas]|uniref:Damage-inducible protein YebG n=1 Tax=Pseudoalteromonas fuliginea TaxID=1872678 RepID=A0ABQ6RGA1_9GAMM|nr:YebG family protein [Pseudoalteromonas fuliginea]KAA1154068.1 damage-inducible protein YebG [Pseudoalteromonas fuliginea]KAA1166686.1 damage-inducible protein YebG [Pseudoalteromonas fuliginea]